MTADKRPHALYPDLYRDEAVHGVDYTMAQVDAYVRTDDDGRVIPVICIERVPLSKPLSIHLRDGQSH